MAIQLTCYLLALAGLLTGFVWGTIRAFQNGVGWGLTFLFVPFGWVAYLVRHWREAWPPVLLSLSGAGLLLVTAGSPTSWPLRLPSLPQPGQLSAWQAQSRRAHVAKVEEERQARDAKARAELLECQTQAERLYAELAPRRAALRPGDKCLSD